MKHQILDHFEDEKPNPQFLHHINLAVGVLILLVGLCLMYNCYYWYDIGNTTFIPIHYYVSNYQLLAWLSFGALLSSGGFRIIRKEKLGIEIIHVVAIAMIIYSIIIVCFDNADWLGSLMLIFPYLLLAALLLAYSRWKKLHYLYSNLSLSVYLWLVGIIVGIIPFLFFWKELVS